jgi:hypothetical protein
VRNALRELVLRDALGLTACALATLFVIGLLSVLAENLPSTAQTGFDLWQRLQRKELRHESQTPRAQAKQRKLARALNIRHLVWEASRLSAQLAAC